MNRRPPLLPRLALRLFIPRERFDEVDGDLLELFGARVAETGHWRARWRYWSDAASILRRRRHLTRMGIMHTPSPSLATTLVNAIRELRYAARALAKRPGYAAIAALTLALGLGANVAIFTVVNGVLLRPLPFPDSDRIVEVRHHAPGINMRELQSSFGLIAQYRTQAKTLTPMAGVMLRQLNVAGGGPPERVRAAAATPEIFDVLATRPAIGRPFTDADAAKEAAPVAVLTHAFWQARFGGDPSIVGRTMQIDGRPTEVIGVMPRTFVYPDPQTHMLVPLWLDAASGFGSFGTSGIARLQPGVTLDAARREVEQLQGRIPEWFPDLTPSVLSGFAWAVSVTPMRERMVANISATLWIREVGPFAMYHAITDGYFEALGVPLIEGRAPERADAVHQRDQVWVNQALARQFLDNRGMGESIKIGDTWLEIAGVVGDVKTFGLREDTRPMAYLPIGSAVVGVDVMHFVVRTAGSPAAMAPAIRSAVDRVDTSVPLTTMRTLEDLVAESVAQLSFAMTLLEIASGLSLLLGVVGLYGVISYIVSQRNAEIGIRLALGAEPSRVRGMILRQGLTVAVTGVAVGIVLAVAVTRVMASLLFEVSARDPLTFAAVAALLTVVSALAISVPAHRASGIDPVGTLRQYGWTRP